MASRSLVLLFAAFQVVAAFRMKKDSHTKLQAPKLIAGVPLLNVDEEMVQNMHNSESLVDASGARDWILMLRSDATDAQLATFCEGSKVACAPEGHVGVTPFIEVHGTEDDLKEILEAHPGQVDFVEPDAPTYAIPELPGDDAEGLSVQQATWGLNKIGKTTGTSGGEGVHVYVADTGVRTTHSDFGGRAIPTLEYLGTSPKACNGDVSCARDVHGHGTHCAGTVGGNKYGVASKATLHGVKVLSDSGSGSVSWIVGAIDWIVTNGQRPAVVSMSLGGGGRAAAYQRSIDVATSKGVTVVVAAGNNNADACNFSPAYVPSAITVGSTDSRDARSGFSNKGKCVEIYAPGSSVQSAGHRSDTASATMSGTSMACPHVAGAAALLLEADPGMSPSKVLETMLAKAASNVLTGLTNTCPNKLLWVGSGPAPTAASQ